VLYDDRPDRAGVKFNDAELIGNPIRISLSARTLANDQAEIRLRSADDSTFVAREEVVATVQRMLVELHRGLDGSPAA
jgi:prolyl-tRNA synthetase